ncbi:MAG: beta-propeller fold lactonase family protein [Planctomycetota bacterium]|nr:beta-propeller fold lactonase family protein [Planctomycetota bacterium]
MKLIEAGNGFGVLLPYQVNELDATGQPTTKVISIRTQEDLLDNVTDANPIHPVVQWPMATSLPDGAAGNHFVFARFKQPLDVESILTGAPGAPSHLLGTILATALDPTGGEPVQIAGRAFIGGQTMSLETDATGQHVLQTWVRLVGGKPVAVLDVDGDGSADFAAGQQPGLGFPGTETAFAGAADLLDNRTFVFVPDADGDLSTHETFPAGAQINLTITTGVKARNGNFLTSPALASSTVGPDLVRPEVSQSSGLVQIIPGNGEVDVDPQTSVSVRFTEPIQPATVGDLPDGTAPSLSPAILLQFGPSTSLVQIPFQVHVPSVFDLSQVVLEPIYAFPGTGPELASCGTFSDVDVIVNSLTIDDLAANRNANALVTSFTTGEGPGLVNAPVTPDAIFVGRGGAMQSLSVVDLNGFGQGTGSPEFDVTCAHQKGNTNFPNNPNVLFLGPLLIPPLSPGGCTVDGGSSGVLTLTKDSSLDDRLLRAPLIQSVGDMMLGHPLDTTFHNGSPFGCQSGGGNQCAITARKSATFATGGATFTLTGFANLMQFAPHPNPPPLRFPPLCIEPFIGGEEPTSVDTFVINAVTNLLLPGGLPFGSGCIPADGLLSPTANILTTWGGPSLPTAIPPVCQPYSLRQQVGNYLYVVDRVAGQVVVLNSNRMTVLERFQLPDPTELAMSPNLNLLAVTNQAADTVTFLDIDPASSTFHQIVRTTTVGAGPTGIAWEPGNEDILVCNTAGGSMSIISAFNLQVRKTVTALLSSPFDVAITPRQLGFGFQRGVYFAYVLSKDGTVAVFESGPDGVNGWGFDDMIGKLPMTFDSPKAIQPDPTNFNSAVWVVHERKLGLDGEPTGLDGGAVTNVGIVSGTIGIIPLDLGFFADPTIRDLEWGVISALGEDQLTGVPTDIAFDNWTNFTVFPNYSTAFSAGTPVQPNAKGILLTVPGGGISAATVPRIMLLAVPNSTEGPGVIDVVRIDGALRMDTDPFTPGTQSIPAPGAITVMDYFRQ